MRKNRFILLGTLLMMVLVVAACQKEPENGSETLTDEMEKAQVEGPAFVPDPTILESITVELGAKAPGAEAFYSEYSGQEFQVLALTEEKLSRIGTSSVTVISDGAYYSVKINVVDTTAPVIEGTEDKFIQKGGTVSYRRHVTVSDNSKEEIKLEIDASQANLDELGTYPVYYSATDSSGNTARVEITLTVTEKPVINEDYVRPMVEKIVNQVTDDDMSEWDKAYALFRWCRKNIDYGAAGDRTSIWTGAYEGIRKHRGDCFTYYATYAALLEVAGIENMMIQRAGGETNHWWNLVNVGDGWYHCDTTPRVNPDYYVCFMQTDEQVAEYTKSNKRKPNYYTFDESLYPERGTKIVYGK